MRAGPLERQDRLPVSHLEVATLAKVLQGTARREQEVFYGRSI